MTRPTTRPTSYGERNKQVMFRSERVPVPPELRERILALGPKGRALKVLGVTKWIYDDAVAPGGTLVPKTLAKLLAALDATGHPMGAEDGP